MSERNLRIYQTLVEELRQRIRQGEWLPGERLPSISQLARDLAVGAGSVREALRSLEAAGMVRIEHGRGVFVSGKQTDSALASHFEDNGRGLFLALAEARRLLEPELAALAAERGTDEELAEIDRLARQTEREARLGLSFVDSDVRLHQQIAAAAHNPILQHMLESFSDLLRQSRGRVVMDESLTTSTVRYHLMLAEAICKRNANQARVVMLAHMNDMVDSVLEIEARAAQNATSNETGVGRPALRR